MDAPEVLMDTLMDQLIINAFAEHAMIIFDVLGAYLNTEMSENNYVLLKLEYKFVDIICEVNLELIKYVKQEGKESCYI